MTRSEIKNLTKRVDGISRSPELEKAYKEGEMHTLNQFTRALRLLPIETQDQVIEAFKQVREAKTN